MKARHLAPVIMFIVLLMEPVSLTFK